MKLEAKKFRLREVVKHVLRTAAASVQNKNLDLQEIVNDDVPLEVATLIFHLPCGILFWNLPSFTVILSLLDILVVTSKCSVAALLFSMRN
jgi:hypothetical protein